MQKSPIDFKIFIFILVVIFILITLNGWGYLQGPKNAVLSLLSPAESRFQSSSNVFSDFFYTIDKIGKFKDENEKLQQENRSLTYSLAALKEVQKENEDLKKQLKFKSDLCGGTDCINFEKGRIIGRSPDSYGEYIIINLGEKDGARKDQAVVVDGGIMIGKISEVFNDYSKVMLIISPESCVNSLTQTTRANGLVCGKYGTSVKLEKIGQTEELAQDDLLITSGLEAGIPKGLLLGKIQGIQQSPNTIFKSADIEVFADFSHIEEVFLVK
jgi:rod shape-determining protein MreC